jgi:hypothetical protein
MAYTNDTKPSAATYSNDTKPSVANEFLLKEDAFYLLLESGSKIVINYGINYSYDTKPS